MRASLTFGLVLALAQVAWAQGQPKKEKDKPISIGRTILANLQTEVKTESYKDQMRLARFFTETSELLKGAGKDVRFVVDEEAFRSQAPDFEVLDAETRLRNLPAKASVGQLLRQVLGQLPIKAAFVIRAGRVDIVPYAHTAKEHMLNQTFHADFNDRRLDQALEDLSELTGVSIVVDGRARQKAQSTVTAKFNDDVAVQDAVRMLTDMAELKVVYLVTGLYITTPEHAPVMQKELMKAYGIPETMPAGPGFTPGAVPGGFGMVGGAPDVSPLTPPLPPSRNLNPGAAVSTPVKFNFVVRRTETAREPQRVVLSRGESRQTTPEPARLND